MVTGGSPNDPVFFLHHCYIDRVWAQWQAQHNNDLDEDLRYPKDGSITYPGTEKRIEGQNRKDKMFSMNANFDGATVDSVFDHHKLGYFYDFELPSPRISTMAKQTVKKGRTVKKGSP